jgi:hypothetical protein
MEPKRKENTRTTEKQSGLCGKSENDGNLRCIIGVPFHCIHTCSYNYICY